MTDWKAIRSEFPALREWTFLNTATFGQMPQAAKAAMIKHLEHRDELACMDFLDWFTDVDRLRGRIAALIGAAAADIAFVPNASTALSLLVQGIEWRPGDRAITLEEEFPNNLYLPALLRAGVEFEAVSWDRFPEAMERGARLVTLSMLNYCTGFRAPLEELLARARAAGALVYVDATQGLGALTFDVQRYPVDMLAVHGYKWMLAPNGAGFMYVSPETRRWLQPAVVGWRSHKNWRNVSSLHHGTPEFTDAAEKYEGGFLPMALLYAFEQSVAMIQEIGPERVEHRVLALAELARTTLQKLGATVNIEQSPIISARFDRADAPKLVDALAREGILVAARRGGLRVSTHFYNNEDDVWNLGQALQRLLR